MFLLQNLIIEFDCLFWLLLLRLLILLLHLVILNIILVVDNLMLRWFISGKLKQFTQVHGLMWRQARKFSLSQGDEDDVEVPEQIQEPAEQNIVDDEYDEEGEQDRQGRGNKDEFDSDDSAFQYESDQEALAPAFTRILKSNIENLSILDQSYMYMPKEHLHMAIQQRLTDIQQKHPLDLLSMLKLKSYSRKNLHNRMKTLWNRTLSSRQLNFVTIAQTIHTLITSRSYKDILTNEQAFIVFSNIFQEPYLQRMMMMRGARFITEYLSQGVTASILEKVGSQKLSLKYLTLLRYQQNIRNGTKNNRAVMFISVSTIKKLLSLNFNSSMSRLQLKYYLMFLAEPTYKNLFSLQQFITDLNLLSNGHKYFNQSMQYVINTMYQENQTIGYLLADVFFTSPTFNQAITNIVDLLRVLEKVALDATNSHGLFKAFEDDKKMWEETWKNKVPNCLKAVNEAYLVSYIRLFKNRRQNIKEEDGMFNQAVLNGGSILVNGKRPFSIQPLIQIEEIKSSDSPFKKMKSQYKYLSQSSQKTIDSVVNNDYVNLLDMVEDKLMEARVHTWFQYQDLKKQLTQSEQFKQLGGSTQAQKRNREAMYILAQTTGFMLNKSRPIVMRDVLEPPEAKYDSEDDQYEQARKDRKQGQEDERMDRDDQDSQFQKNKDEEDKQISQEEVEPQESVKPTRNLRSASRAMFSTSKFGFSSGKPQKAPQNQEEEIDGLASYLQKLRDVDQTVTDTSQKQTQQRVFLKKSQVTSTPKETKGVAKEQPKVEESKISPFGQDIIKKINTSTSFKEACAFLFAAIQKNQRPNLFEQIVSAQNIKYFKNGENLLVGTFLYGLSNKAQSTPSSRLQVSFQSQEGAVEKDYNKYIDVSKSIINFPLSSSSYILVIRNIAKDFSRLHFKRTLSHIIEHCQTIDYELLKQICDLANRQKTAFTLLQFMQMVLKNNIEISSKAFTLASDVLGGYKIISNDVPTLYRDFCAQYKWNMEPQALQSYLSNIVKAKNSQKITEVTEIFKAFVQPKKYKMKEGLTPVQNSKLQAQQKVLAAKLNCEMGYRLATVLSRNGQTEQSEVLMDQYRENKKTPLTDTELSVSYLCYSNNVQKFKTLVELQGNRPITKEQMENVIKALEMRGKVLANQMENVFNLFVFSRNYMLSEPEIWQMLRCVRRNQNTQVFSRIVEHLVRTQPPISPSLKQNLYKYLTVSKDDNGKLYSKNLLSILFDRETLDERKKIKKEWDAEQEKKKKLAEITTEARKKMQERRRIEQQQEAELMLKHGIQKITSQKETKVAQVKKAGKPEKLSKEEMIQKIKQEKAKDSGKKPEEAPKKKATESPDYDTALRAVLDNTEALEAKLSATPRKEPRSKDAKDKYDAKARPQSKAKSQKSEKDSGKKKAVASESQGKTEKKQKEVKTEKKATDQKKDEKKDKKESAASPSSTTTPKKQTKNTNNLVELSDKKKISSKMIRRGGRNKFFEMSFTDEQIEEEEASKSKRKGK